jgi:hypothetical protein
MHQYAVMIWFKYSRYRSRPQGCRYPSRAHLVAVRGYQQWAVPLPVGHPSRQLYGDLKIVALDFGGHCFLPPVFFAVAMKLSWDEIILEVARHVNYSRSEHLEALVAAY